MPALTNASLFAKLRAALPPSAHFETPPNQVHPAVAVIPGFGRTRFYLWTVTADRSAPGARPPGEYKIQLIVEGQARNQRGNLDYEGAFTVLMGYSPDFGIFVGWEARIYRDFAYSRNVQVRDQLLAEGRSTGWGVGEPRSLQDTEEVRVAFSAGNLMHFLRVSRAADQRDHFGEWREAFFLSRTPSFASEGLPTRSSQSRPSWPGSAKGWRARAYHVTLDSHPACVNSSITRVPSAGSNSRLLRPPTSYPRASPRAATRSGMGSPCALPIMSFSMPVGLW